MQEQNPIKKIKWGALLLMSVVISYFGAALLYDSISAIWIEEIVAVKIRGRAFSPDIIVKLQEDPQMFWGNVILKGIGGTITLFIFGLSTLASSYMLLTKDPNPEVINRAEPR